MKYLLDTCVVSETRRRAPNVNLTKWRGAKIAVNVLNANEPLFVWTRLGSLMNLQMFLILGIIGSIVQIT